MTSYTSVKIFLTQLCQNLLKNNSLKFHIRYADKARKTASLSRYFFQYVRIKEEPRQETCPSLRTWSGHSWHHFSLLLSNSDGNCNNEINSGVLFILLLSAIFAYSRYISCILIFEFLSQVPAMLLEFCNGYARFSSRLAA